MEGLPVPDSTSAELVARARALLQEVTPWPWAALQNNGEVAGVTRLLHPETQHDICHCETRGREDAGHNAAFIAASPELVDSLATALEQAQTELRERDERIAAETERANDNLNAYLYETEMAERFGLALRAIRAYPKGWENRGSIADFISATLENTDQPTPATEDR